MLTPVVTDPKLAAVTLKNWAIKEMERRYEEFSLVGVKNIEGYNQYIEDVWKKTTVDGEAVQGSGFKVKGSTTPNLEPRTLNLEPGTGEAVASEASGVENDPRKAFKKLP